MQSAGLASTPAQRVAIIGAGAAGLCAANYLLARGGLSSARTGPASTVLPKTEGDTRVAT